MPAPLTVWLSFEVEGETFEMQFPTNATDEHLALLEARDELQHMLRKVVDQSKATHYEASFPKRDWLY